MITIQNNDGDRRVLLLDNPFALDESPDFPEYLFDVVFIANNSAEETKTILSGINPVTSTTTTSSMAMLTTGTAWRS